MKKTYVSLRNVILIALCSALIGLWVAAALRISPESKAQPFWEEGNPQQTLQVVLPSLSALANQVRPTVVNIRTTKVVNRKDLYQRFYGPQEEGGPFEDFYKKFFENMPEKEMEQRSLGSGFIISQDGYILTNNHVIAGAEEILISLSDDEEYRANVIGKDDKTDIALIKIDAGDKKLPGALLGNSDTLEIGDWVIAMGNPFGLGHTLTQGIVSAKARIIGAGPYDNFIQTDAAINPGNSGGPLLDMNGHVVGINTAIVASGQGIGFAIPINMVKQILAELKETGEVSRGWLGVAIQQVTPELARAVDLDEARGAMVTIVYPGDPADSAGVQKGDIILELNSQSIKDPHGLTRLVGNLKPGSEITIVVWRGSKVIELSTTLKKRDEEHVAGFGQDMDKNVETKDKLGLTIVDITPDIASKYSLKDAGGVLVIDIDSESSSVKSDIQRGDIIKEINRHEITDMRDYLAMLENVKKGQTVLLLIIRNSRPLYIAMDVD